MRIFVVAASLAAFLVPATPALADSPRQNYREYRYDVREAQRDYYRDLRRADSRRDVRRAQREYRRELREARRDLRRDQRRDYRYYNGRRYDDRRRWGYRW
jgi:hypothetical protein